jgi:RND family efflux transporter MFP subunit
MPPTFFRYAIVLTATLLSACSDTPSADKKTTLADMRVSVIEIAQRQVETGVALTGELAPRRVVRINAEVDGAIVRRVLVDAGERVERGQPLLQVDDRALRLELLQADAESRRAATDAARLRAELGRLQRVVAVGGVSANDLDAKRSEFESAQENTVASAAARDLAARRVEKARFTAPEDGLVLSRNVEVGDRTGSSNEPYFVIAADGELEFQASAGARQLQDIQPGLRAIIQLADGSAPLSGTVRAAAVGVDARDRSGVVRIGLDTPGAGRSGEPATARIVSASRRALVVPAGAVHFDPHPWVWVIARGNVVQRRELQLGATTEPGFEVVSGLRAGESVVGDAGALLVAGDRVEPVRARAAQKTPQGTVP